MSQVPSISDAFKTIVTKVDAEVKANPLFVFGSIPKAVYFMQGNIKEITAVLQSYSDGSETKDERFPLVALFRDIKETLYPERSGLGSEFRCKFGIFTLTDPNYRAADREVNSFKPILLPIFEEIIKNIGKSPLFGMPTVKDMAIVKWDCYFYGSSLANQANPFNDYVDAIEVELNLKLKNIC